jgi:hypothetical protein
MSFSQLVGSQFGYQKVSIVPTFPANASSTNFITVASIPLAGGLWICNVNSIEFSADNFGTGARMNNMRQQIVYDGVIRDRASIIGTSIYGCELSSIAVIKTDGVTPVLIQLQGQTTDASSFTIDSGFVTFTRLY